MQLSSSGSFSHFDQPFIRTWTGFHDANKAATRQWCANPALGPIPMSAEDLLGHPVADSILVPPSQKSRVEYSFKSLQQQGDALDQIVCPIRGCTRLHTRTFFALYTKHEHDIMAAMEILPAWMRSLSGNASRNQEVVRWQEISDSTS